MATNDCGEAGARKAIEIYGPELELMARATLTAYPEWRPVVAAYSQQGSSLALHNRSELPDSQVPIRTLEDGSTLSVLPESAFREMLATVEPGLLPSFEAMREVEEPGRGLPILAACRDGMLMGLRPLEAPL